MAFHRTGSRSVCPTTPQAPVEPSSRRAASLPAVCWRRFVPACRTVVPLERPGKPVYNCPGQGGLRSDSVDIGGDPAAALAVVFSAEPGAGSHAAVLFRPPIRIHPDLQTDLGRLWGRPARVGNIAVSRLGAWTDRTATKNQSLARIRGGSGTAPTGPR